MSLSLKSIENPAFQKLAAACQIIYNHPFAVINPSDCVLPEYYINDAKRILDFEVREDDVWVISYPKCGTTWTQEMVWLLVNNLDYEGAKQTDIVKRFPFIEFASFQLPLETTVDWIDILNKDTKTRCIKSHLPVELLPRQIWTKKPKVVYVARNPKDVVLSYFHHHRSWTVYSGSFETFADAFLDDVALYGPYWKHVLDFWNLKEPYVLFNTYEEMKAGTDIMALHFEDVKSPLVEKMKQNTKRKYKNGMVKITPSDCVLPTAYRNFAQRVKDFHVREDDVWIVTYPKCGTTWTQEMVWLIMHDLDFEAAKERLDMRSPFVEFWGLCDPEEEKDIGTKDTIAFTDNCSSPRCIKSHLPKELLPDQLWTKKPKIVYVTRNVKDVVVSLFYHYKLMNGFTGTLEEFVEMFMAENVVYWDPFWKHNIDFWKLKDEPHILLNTYEEMKKDLPSVIRRTATFLGKTVSEEQIAKLADHLSFQNMKTNRSVNFTNVTDVLKKKFNVSADFMRSGESGSYKKELSPELIERLDSWSRERVAGTDYPYVA